MFYRAHLCTRAHTCTYERSSRVSSPLKRSLSCGPGERGQGGGTNTNGCTSGTACKMLFRTTFRRFCALCIVVQIYTHRERRNVPQTPLSADIGFPKKEKGTKAKEEAIGRFGGLILSPPLPLSLFLSLSIRAFRVDFHLAACISPRCNFSRKGRLFSCLSSFLSFYPLPSNECVSPPIVPRDGNARFPMENH